MSALEPRSATKEIYQLIARDLDLYVEEIAQAMVQLVLKHIDKTESCRKKKEVSFSYSSYEVAQSLQREIESFADVEELCPNCLSDNWTHKMERQLIGEYWGTPAYDDVPVGAKCKDCGEEWKL